MDLHDIIKEIKKLAFDLQRTPTIRECIAKTDISKRQINKHGWNELCKMAGLEPNKNSQQKEPLTLAFREPKILTLDIETAPLLVRCYGLWEQNISTGFIVKDWYMISFAARWYGEKKFHYIDTRDTHENDYDICKLAWDMINDADIIVGHNVDRFDIKKLNTRFLKHGFPPIPKKRTIDTLKIAKKYFAITSNKLDYIASFLGLGGKRKSKKYSQQEMWNGCCDGVLDCFKENEKYNKQDIKLTEDVFDGLKAWDESLNFQSFHGKLQCVCGSFEFRKDGMAYNKQSVHQRYRCDKCGKVHTEKQNLLDKEVKKEFFK